MLTPLSGAEMAELGLDMKAKQQQMAQALAEVAEQNAVLIAAVTRLKRQLRWMAVGLALAWLGLAAIVLLAYLSLMQA